jgi:D-alanyl-lipoteichoic acid acyltransferase DltB (MBOAT superfamily)
MAFIPKYILILFLTIVVDYSAGIFIENAREQWKKKAWLVVSLVSTVSILFVFKYFNFFRENAVQIAHFFHWNYSMESLQIILPIGLSFHTFQSMSYVIEVYRGGQKAEKHFGIYSLYVMFYPQLVAGPIERPQNLLHQFYERHDFDYERVTSGLKLMALGFFKKVVIADNLAGVVNQVYNHPHDYTGFPLILATISFAYQIYCDFSGYSDIAIGSAQVMGFKLMDNFNRPYAASSIAEFWKRWHISLSTWFRDYVYIPLGGNRTSQSRWYGNLFVTFLLSGFWHGANWTYVIWGSLNGMYLILSLMTGSVRAQIVSLLGLNGYPRLHRFMKTVITFSLISFAWIFFRANTIQDAVYIATHLFDGFAVNDAMDKLDFPKEMYFSILFIELIYFTHRYSGTRNIFETKAPLFRWSMYYVMIMGILLYGSYTEQKFIYFQF